MRVLLGPGLFQLASHHAPHWVLFVALLAAMLSDIFDGVVARRLGIVTARMRIADSYADAWFFGWMGLAIYVSHPAVLAAFAVPIGVEILLQMGAYSYDLIRFGKIVSLHAYSAKVWGFSIYLAAAGVLVWHTPSLIWFAFACGLWSFVDALRIKMLLPEWRHDVVSVGQARKLTSADAA